jgi:hypothetical protein
VANHDYYTVPKTAAGIEPLFNQRRTDPEALVIRMNNERCEGNSRS